MTVAWYCQALVDDRERVTREAAAIAGPPWDDACLAYERNSRAGEQHPSARADLPQLDSALTQL